MDKFIERIAYDAVDKTNVEFLTELMEHHPMIQMFVVDAVTKQAEKVAALTDEEVAELDKESPMVNMKAWHTTAHNIREAFKIKYK